MMTDVRRYQKAFEQGIQDATNNTHRLEVAQDEKEYEFYIKGRNTVKEVKVDSKIHLTESGYARQVAEDSEPLPEIIL